FKGQPFKFQRPFGSYVMENVLFKISYPAEFHAQTAVECAMQLHPLVKDRIRDIKRIRIRTHEAAIRIIDKKGPLANPADRDHCIQYMVAVPLIFGRLTAADYEDGVAADPRIDALRAKTVCVEDRGFSKDYLDPDKRSIANAITVEFDDGTKLKEVVVEYPIGHRRRCTNSSTRSSSSRPRRQPMRQAMLLFFTLILAASFAQAQDVPKRKSG